MKFSVLLVSNWRAIRQFSTAIEIFDRKLKRAHKYYALSDSSFCDYDYLKNESARRLIGRIEDINRKFQIALDTSAHRFQLLNCLLERNVVNNFRIGGIEKLIQCDLVDQHPLSTKMEEYRSATNQDTNIETSYRPGDEEDIDFDQESFNLVMSNLSLHWVNNIPKTLQKVSNKHVSIN